MLALDDIIDVGNVDALVKSAQDARQMLVDLQDDDVRPVKYPLGRAGAAGQIEVPVLIHGSHAHHGHVHGEKMPVIGDDIPEDHGNVIAQPAVAELPLVRGTVPAVVHEMLPRGIALHDADGAEAEIAADLDIGQLIAAFGQRRVQKRREANAGGIVDPVAASDDPDGLFGRTELISVALIDTLHDLSTSAYYGIPNRCSDYTIPRFTFPPKKQKDARPQRSACASAAKTRRKPSCASPIPFGRSSAPCLRESASGAPGCRHGAFPKKQKGAAET